MIINNKMMKAIKLSLLLFVTDLLLVVVGIKNPYTTLGISKKSNARDIKQAYKNLVKEWHPDKNKDPAAEGKFIEINEAYQILSDENKRAEYDEHGFIRDTNNQDPNRGFDPHSPFARGSPFYSFFSESGGGGGFSFQFNSDTSFEKTRINIRIYEQDILPSSHSELYLILTYRDWCIRCMQLEPVWEKVSKDLKAIGIKVATVHGNSEPTLARKISSSALPTVVAVLEGRVYFVRPPLTYDKLRQFVRDLFPRDLLTTVNDRTVDEFLNGWHDNKVRVIFFGRLNKPRLRYTAGCFRYRNFAACANVNVNDPLSKQIVHRLGVNKKLETMYIFNEDVSRPVATLSMPELSINSIQDLMASNKYLVLPRLSSQERFDEICRIEPVPARKHICAILITRNIPTHSQYRDALRNYSIAHNTYSNRLSFAYIYEDVQTEFMKAFKSASLSATVASEALRLVIIWRQESSHVYYKWLENGWGVSEELSAGSERRLGEVIGEILRGSALLEQRVRVHSLLDEHAKGLFARMTSKLYVWWDYTVNTFSRDEVMSTLSVLLTFLFIVAGSYLLSYLMNAEEERVKKQNPHYQPEGTRNKNRNDIVRVHEMKSETYNGLVRLLKPGCRTLVLLVDSGSKGGLLTTFTTVVYPYRRNVSLMFAYLDVGRHLAWYRSVLQQTCGPSLGPSLHINARNCVGTVRSLNGHRKYYCIYHPKVSGCRSRKVRGSVPPAGTDHDTPSSSTDTTDTDDVLYLEEMLDGLRPWLDKLFDGQLKRFQLDFWPELGR